MRTLMFLLLGAVVIASAASTGPVTVAPIVDGAATTRAASAHPPVQEVRYQAKHRNGEAKRPNVERLNDDLYESLAQGHQPYPNPDRQLYVPEYDF